jgi:hypothetical protein
MRLVELTQTCYACPSQWEGKLEDGRFVYVRYRWGCLQVGIEDSLTEAIRHTEYLDYEGPDGLHGLMSTEKMLEITEFQFDGEVGERSIIHALEIQED